MLAPPRSSAVAAPRYLTAVPAAELERGDGESVRAFLTQHCRITKDSFGGSVGDPLVLRPWQAQMLDRLFARRPDGRRRARTALIGLPRKNGKSALIAGVALYGLLLEKNGAEVYSVAGDRDQAKLVFGVAKRMVELDPLLSEACRTYRDTIEVPESGSTYRALSADAPLKEGLSPTLTVVDEVHVVDEDLWNVFSLARGARIDPLMVGITTAGVRYGTDGRETICYRLWEYGKRVASGEVDDPSFYLEWWAAPDDADHRDPDTWAVANPGLGDILDPEQLASALGTTPEPEFRTKHLNQWVSSSSSAFPTGAWDSCEDASRKVDPREPIVIGVDGSWTGDSTALVGVTVTGQHAWVIDSWERPIDDQHWRVDAETVDAAVRGACRDFNVVEIACDPHEWRGQIQAWQRDKLPVSEWPTSALSRMVPAWKEFYAAVMEHRLTHDGDPRLGRHVFNTVLKLDRHGARPTKEYGSSLRKIDLLIATLIAWDRARWHATQPRRQRGRAGSF